MPSAPFLRVPLSRLAGFRAVEGSNLSSTICTTLCPFSSTGRHVGAYAASRD